MSLLSKFFDTMSIDPSQYGLILMALLILITKIYGMIKSRGQLTMPTVKGGYPFFGQVFDMIKGSPWDTMTRWVMQYGTIFKFHLFGSDAVCVSDPELLKVMLQTNMLTYKKDLEWTYKPFMVLLGTGLVTADGANWRRQRTLLSHTLRIEILEEIPQMALKAVQRLSVRLEIAKKNGAVIEMAEEFRRLTLQVIAEAVLSLPPEESDETFAKMYLPIVEEGNKRTWNPERMYLPTPAWFKFRADVKLLNDYVSGLVMTRWELRKEEHRKINEKIAVNRKMDILDKTLAAVPNNEWGPDVVKQIRDEIKTFILAGHETSASMLTWSLYEISLHPELSAKIRSESASVFKSNIDLKDNEANPDLDFESPSLLPERRDALEKLEFTNCCLRESLRKYSVVPTVVRVAAQTTKLGEYSIPKGTTLMVNMQGVHHNPEFWPEPLVYKPERFLEETKPYTFLPFIEGPRMCLGQYLSLLESKIVLSLLVLKYDFQITNEDAGEKHAYMVPIIPKTGHFMRVK